MTDIPAAIAEKAAEALIAYETSGLCKLGRTCELCDCGRAYMTVEQRATSDRMDVDRARHVLESVWDDVRKEP